MLNIIEVNSKKTRVFGWIQDSGNIDALCNVVAIFDETSSFHNFLKTKLITYAISFLFIHSFFHSFTFYVLGYFLHSD